MADYGQRRMVPTPWGNADRLRERMLRPGPGLPREQVARNQRERLFGAMVASVAAKGYEATTVADLLELSGVSRSAYYEHFRDKEDCFLATFEAIVAKAIELVGHESGKTGSSESRARRTLDGLFEMIVHQPAAARLCFLEAYTAGEPGRKAVERAMASFEIAVGQTIGQINETDELPPGMIRGLLGGAQAIIQSYLRHDRDNELPALAGDLWDWALGYRQPATTLRLTGRRPRPPERRDPPFVDYSQAERILRALAASAAERGYPAVTIAEIAARASVSQATFYSHFTDRHAALVAALDSAGAQMLGVVMPAARRAPDWPNGIRAAIGAMCAFGAAEPDLARLATVETYAAGRVALDQHDQTTTRIRSLLEPGYALFPATKQIVGDAVVGAIWALLNNQLVTTGPQSLPQIAPLASYMTLAPFIGAEQAAEVANGDGRGTAAGNGRQRSSSRG